MNEKRKKTAEVIIRGKLAPTACIYQNRRDEQKKNTQQTPDAILVCARKIDVISVERDVRIRLSARTRLTANQR